MAPSDLRAIQDCLLSLPGVVDAHVWVKNDSLIGRAAVISDSGWTGRDLQEHCLRSLGPQGSPRLLMLSLVQPEGFRLTA